MKTPDKTNPKRGQWVAPNVTRIQLDSEINILLQSTPPDDPFKSPDPFKVNNGFNPFK